MNSPVLASYSRSIREFFEITEPSAENHGLSTSGAPPVYLVASRNNDRGTIAATKDRSCNDRRRARGRDSLFV